MNTYSIDFTESSGKKSIEIQGTTFSNAITNAIKEKIDLTFANFSGERFVEVDFSNADLTGADFEFGACYQCNFSNAILKGVKFSYVGIWDSNFSNSSFGNAILLETAFVNCDLIGADLEDVQFWQTAVFSLVMGD